MITASPFLPVSPPQEHAATVVIALHFVVGPDGHTELLHGMLQHNNPEIEVWTLPSTYIGARETGPKAAARTLKDRFSLTIPVDELVLRRIRAR